MHRSLGLIHKVLKSLLVPKPVSVRQVLLSYCACNVMERHCVLGPGSRISRPIEALLCICIWLLKWRIIQLYHATYLNPELWIYGSDVKQLRRIYLIQK